MFFQDRLKPDIAAMKQMIVSGELGKPIFAPATCAGTGRPSTTATRAGAARGHSTAAAR